MEDRQKVIYVFGPFLLDPSERQLSRGGESVPLKAKTLDLLLALVRSRGHLVTKDELMKTVWGDSVVEESNLTVHISMLRKALGEHGEAKFIENVPKYGYRFLVEVANITPSNNQIVEESHVLPADASVPPGHSETRMSFGRLVRRFAPLLVLISIAIIVSALTLSSYKSIDRTFAEVRFLKSNFARLTTTGTQSSAAISGDGKYLVYAVNESGKQSLWLRVIPNASDLQLLPPEAVIYSGLTISPDSQAIYYDKSQDFSSEGGIYRIPLLGGVEQKLIGGTSGPPISLSPDGKRFAFVRWNPADGSDNVWLANADGTDAHKLASHKIEGAGDTCSPAWAPGGKIVVCAWGLAEGMMNLFGVSVEDGSIKPLLPARWEEVGEVVWLRDGSGMIITAREKGSQFLQLWLVSYPDGHVRRITNDTANYRSISSTNDSTFLSALQIDRISNIWVAQNVGTRQQQQITFRNYDGDSNLGFSWTPQGQIVYATATGGQSAIWIVDADGRNQRQLTPTTSNYMPIVTPDGSKIVYCSDGPDKMPHIWIMDSDGGNPKQVTDGPIEFLPRVSPDGKWIVYHTYLSGVTSLYKIPIEGGQPVFLLDKLMDTYSPVSPDGQFVACVWLDDHDGKKSWKLGIAPFEGGPVVKDFDIQPSPIGFASLAWTSDSKQVMYLAKENGVSNIYQVAVETGKTTKLTDFTSGRIFYFDWSRDGRQLAIARGEVKQDVILISDIKTEEPRSLQH